MMEIFSLEEEDSAGLFITQGGIVNNDNCGNNSILGDPMDFKSPCVSLVSQPKVNTNAAEYSDISDDDDFEIPSSQVCASGTR